MLLLRACICTAEEKGGLLVVVFTTPGCDRCKPVTDTVIPQIKRTYRGMIRLRHIPVVAPDEIRMKMAYEAHYGVDQPAPAEAFLGDVSLVGTKEILSRLEGEIAVQIAAGARTPTPEELIKKKPVTKSPSYDAAVMLVSGLIDGINPCAFATLLFLLSLLVVLTRGDRKTLACTGGAFVAGVFLTYLLVGVGILYAVRAALLAGGVGTLVKYGTGVFAALAGIAVGVDALAARGGAHFRTGVPERLRKLINRTTSTAVRSRGGGIAVGFMLSVPVSLTESICTGQIYLPAITYMVGTSGERWRWTWLLLVYNTAFILPLFTLFLLVTIFSSAKTIQTFVQKHAVASRMLVAVCMMGLGALILLR